MNNKIQGAGLIFTALSVLIAVLIFIGIYSSSEATHFQGIADSTETVINSESSVEIQKILVVEGQKVVAGEKLAELANPELSLRISDINNQLLQLESEKGMGKAEIKSKLIQVQVAEQTVVNDLNAQVRSLENQAKINKELASGLKSFEIKKGGDNLKNPILLQIESLKQEIEDRKKEFSATAQMYRNMLVNSDLPVKIQTERLNEELKMLNEKSENLAVFASFEGIVGSVFFKGGEKIAPFTPILSINKKEPSVVKGYIHESFYSGITTGDKVTVISIDGKKKISGEVAGLGNRIVPYPLRLLKIPTYQLWGREITVKIPEANGFILGEKVTIISERSGVSNLFSKLTDIFNPVQLSAQELSESSKEIISENSVKIEASGAVFLKKTGLFALISDETEKKSPVIFLMDKKGVVVKELVIKGLKKMDDMESIALLNDNTVLIMSSLSHSKKGNLKDHRKILAMVLIQKESAELIDFIDFYSVLGDFAKSGESEFQKFVSSAIGEKTLDIEGMFVKEGAIYISFKNPLLNKKPVIMKIDHFLTIFKEKKINPQNASTLLIEGIDENERISDIYFSGDLLYFTTSCSKRKSGGFYKYEENRAVEIKRFSDLKPEGIAADNDFYIFFDEGGKSNSRFMEIKK
ncbi:MAG: HlyD family secretion protein [bacterium]